MIFNMTHIYGSKSLINYTWRLMSDIERIFSKDHRRCNWSRYMTRLARNERGPRKGLIIFFPLADPSLYTAGCTFAFFTATYTCTPWDVRLDKLLIDSQYGARVSRNLWNLNSSSTYPTTFLPIARGGAYSPGSVVISTLALYSSGKYWNTEMS